MSRSCTPSLSTLLTSVVVSSSSECNTGLGGTGDCGVDDGVIVGDAGDAGGELVCGVSDGVGCGTGCGTGVGSGRGVCDCGEGSRRPRL